MCIDAPQTIVFTYEVSTVTAWYSLDLECLCLKDLVPTLVLLGGGGNFKS